MLDGEPSITLIYANPITMRSEWRLNPLTEDHQTKVHSIPFPKN